MNIFYKIILRVVLFAVIIVIMSFLYDYFLSEKDIQTHSDIINLSRDIQYDTKVIYIGESSNITFQNTDLDKRPISSFVADFFPELKMADITLPASHAGIYKVLLNKINKESEINTVIVTLNLRSFNAQWIYSKLETSLQKSLVLLNDYPPFFNRFLLSFKAYDNKTETERKEQIDQKWKNELLKFPYNFPHRNVTEWDNWMASTQYINDQNDTTQKNIELACHYIKAYAFTIDTFTNPRIHDFDKIIELSKKRGWNLIFNLMAENTEKAQSLVGKELIYLMEHNRKILTDYFQKKGVTVVDNLNAVENIQFIDQDWTTEHYAEVGRKTIAQNVAQKLKQFYPDKYYHIDYSSSQPTYFFNDCDKQIIWGQMQTITDVNSYSGNYSSSTGKGNDFSITFEYPFNKIPDTSTNIINIGFRTFMYSNSHDAKLVIELSGSKIEYYWNGIPIADQVTTINEWKDYNYTLNIPEEVKQADLIKIYIYNPSKSVILVDDLRVEFK
ncbi:MAG: DUF4843 domain-containing protein [Bacteroidetes bacterium]|nr:DUF4843 domain-containing protein [Bacteroidota bacterium]